MEKNNKPSWKTLLFWGIVLLLISGGLQFIIAIVGILLIIWAFVILGENGPKYRKKRSKKE